MLVGKLKFKLDTKSRKYSPNIPFWMQFAFKDGDNEHWFSGQIKGGNLETEYLKGETYTVDIEFPFITNENDMTYTKLKPLLKKNMRMVTHENGRIRGDAYLLDFEYVGGVIL